MRRLFISDRRPRRFFVGPVMTLAVFAIYVACGPVDSPLPPPSRAAGTGCAMSGTDHAWLTGALDAWRFTRDDILGAANVTPAIVARGADCAWITAPGDDPVDAAAPIRDWRGGAHDGDVALPDGTRTTPDAPTEARRIDGGILISAALPSARPDDDPDVLTARFVEAMARAERLTAYARQIEDLAASWERAAPLSGDAVQERYAAVLGYVSAFERERDRLYEAAAIEDPVLARGAARAAWALMEARRLQWFTGLDAEFTSAERLFLTADGIAAFAGAAWLSDPRGGGLDRAAATAALRDPSDWSRDEGLALFLVVDRLDPTWTARAYADPPIFAGPLLSQALAAPPRG